MYTHKKCNTCEKTMIVIDGLDPEEPLYTCTVCCVRKSRLQTTLNRINELSELVKKISHKPYTLDKIDEKIDEISHTIELRSW